MVAWDYNSVCDMSQAHCKSAKNVSGVDPAVRVSTFPIVRCWYLRIGS